MAVPLAPAAEPDAPAVASPGRQPFRHPLGRLLRHRGGQIGLSIGGLLILLAIIGPYLTPNPNATNYAQQLLAPSLHHWLGTDENGRDELARTFAGMRTTFSASAVIFALSTTVGLLVGGISGYLGGPLDAFLSRVIDVLLGLPSVIVALAVVGALGIGFWNLVAAISFSGWAYIARMARSNVLGSRNRLDVTAARLAGISEPRLFASHVLPATLAAVSVVAASTVADTILSLAGLSFLGLGAQPPTAELGAMLSDSRGDLASCPWLAVGPCVVLVLAVASAILLSDALRDVTDVNAATRRSLASRRNLAGHGLLLSRRNPAGQRGPAGHIRSTREAAAARAPQPARAVSDAAAGRPLVVTGLEVIYPDGSAALRGVSLTVERDECVAVVGESGCGKTTLARCLLRLLPDGTELRGSALLAGTDVLTAAEAELLRIRGMTAGYVSQDPFAACDPLQSVRRHVEEPWRDRRLRPPRDEAVRRVEALGITQAWQRLRQRPHQWSGGMLQRATIAAANAHQPVLTIADEPTSALDAELADGVLGVIRADSSSVLLVSHDLRLVAEHSDRVVVLYAGQVAETGATATVIDHPRHPYTQALLAASPRRDGSPIQGLPGEPPSPRHPPPGCAFAPRCPRVLAVCHTAQPELTDGVACWAVNP
jgi:peptide/nickel transport system permease protein